MVDMKVSGLGISEKNVFVVMSTPRWVTLLYCSVPQVTLGVIRLWLLRELHIPAVR